MPEDPNLTIERLRDQIATAAFTLAWCVPDACETVAQYFAEYHPEIMLKALEDRTKELAEGL